MNTCQRSEAYVARMASADDCFACLAVLLEDGQAEGIAAELPGAREHKKDAIRERGAGFIGQEADQVAIPG